MLNQPKTWLLLALAGITAIFLGVWIRGARTARPSAGPRRGLYHSIGFVLCFLDTLGIGNFAPTTSALKLRGSVPDEQIPGTLNVGYTVPTAVQAAIYIKAVEVEFTTLSLMIAASILGAWLGAGFVARWPRRYIQIGMGFALLAASTLLLLSQLNAVPGAGSALGLNGGRLAAAVAGNFVLGALMTLGIGAYAPCLILVSLLGMNPRAAFPIMMGSCAFLMPVAGIRFVRAGTYHRPASIALTLAGVPAVFVAAYLVRELSLTQVRWLVLAVALYAAILMIRSAFRRPGLSPEGPS
jgi:uncharacterized membrane protein YfcA